MIRRVVNYEDIPKPNLPPLKVQPPSARSISSIINDIQIDCSNTLTPEMKELFKDTIRENVEIFQPDLPGYNGAFGPVHADFQFTSKARPVPQKIRAVNYGSYGQLLFKKCHIRWYTPSPSNKFGPNIL